MTIEEKIENFLLSKEVEEIAKEVIGITLLEMNPFNLGIGLALLDLIIENRPKESELKDFVKNFFEKNNIEIPEDKINELYEYLRQSFFPKILELQKEVEIPEIKEETFEEKEKRYLEMMGKAVKKPEIYEEEKKKIVIEPETEKPKTLTIESKEKKEEVLPEGTVIIKRKDEEEKKEGEILDLSNL